SWRRLPALALVLLGSFVSAPLAQGPGDDEILIEFKRYFRKYKDTPTRVESVLALEGCELPEVVDVLAPLFDTAEPEVGVAVLRVLSKFKTRPPIDRLLSELSTATETVKIGLLRVLAQAHYADTQAGILPLIEDQAWDVRRRAIQALVALGDPAVGETILRFCSESEVGVRCAALDGLAELRSQ